MKRGRKSKENRRRKPKVISGGLVRLKKKFHADTPSVSASHSANNENGILHPDAINGEKSPDSLNGEGDVKPLVLLPGRIMLTITFLGMIFIAIMTWFVARMP
jgi:hypothetical protein